jgi:dihydrofolate synthase/folylpolyglutamate synthase
MLFGLDEVRAACERVGSPHLACPVVHIAGTNGKGSAASMVASVLQAAGYRTGLFTSPHLVRFAERIQVNGTPLDERVLSEVLWEAIEAGPKLSFFETTFLAAMLGFRRAAVDVAVLEVGLGGRLDATNVVERPLATAITRIALDHMDKLGSTEAEIAAEKAAIAKPGVPMVLGPMSDAIDGVCRGVAGAAGARELFGLGRELEITVQGPGEAELRLPCGPIALRPQLHGLHQLDNAAVAAALAWLASRALSKVDAGCIAQGIARAQWPGRLEYVSDGAGPVLLDAAHNPDGARALLEHLRGRGHKPAGTALVFGAMADKSWREMLGLFAALAEHRFYVEPGGRAAAPVAELAALHAGSCPSGLQEALADARRAVGSAGLVLVAGSIFLAGHARAILLQLPRDPPVAL